MVKEIINHRQNNTHGRRGSHSQRHRPKIIDDLEFDDNPEELLQLERLEAQLIAAAEKNTKTSGSSLKSSLTELVESVSGIFLEEYYYEEVNVNEEHAYIMTLDATEVSSDTTTSEEGQEDHHHHHHHRHHRHDDVDEESDKDIKERIWREHYEDFSHSGSSHGSSDYSDVDLSDNGITTTGDYHGNNKQQDQVEEGSHTNTTAQETEHEEEEDDTSEGMDAILDPYFIVEIPAPPPPPVPAVPSWYQRRQCRLARSSSSLLQRPSSGAYSSSSGGRGETRLSWLGGVGCVGVVPLVSCSTTSRSSGAAALEEPQKKEDKPSVSRTQQERASRRFACFLTDLEVRSPRALQRVFFSNRNQPLAHATFRNHSDVIEELRAHRASMNHQQQQKQSIRAGNYNDYEDNNHMPVLSRASSSASSSCSSFASSLRSSSCTMTFDTTITSSNSDTLTNSNSSYNGSSSSCKHKLRDNWSIWRYGMELGGNNSNINSSSSNSDNNDNSSSSEGDVNFSISLSD